MATQKRPKDEAAASAPAADDTLLIDGSTNGVRALAMSYFRNNFAPIPNLDREIRADAPIAYWPMTDPLDDGYFVEALSGAGYLTPRTTPFYRFSQMGAGVQASAGLTPYDYANTVGIPTGTAFLQGDYTVEMVVSTPTALSATEALFFVGAAPGLTSPEADYSLMALTIDHTTMQFQLRTGDNIIFVSSHNQALQPGQVYHLVATRIAPGTAYLYVNGLRTPTTGTGMSPDPAAGANARVWVHSNLAGPLGITGFISMGYLAVYDKALTPDRITAHAVNLSRA